MGSLCIQLGNMGNMKKKRHWYTHSQVCNVSIQCIYFTLQMHASIWNSCHTSFLLYVQRLVKHLTWKQNHVYMFCTFYSASSKLLPFPEFMILGGYLLDTDWVSQGKNWRQQQEFWKMKNAWPFQDCYVFWNTHPPSMPPLCHVMCPATTREKSGHVFTKYHIFYQMKLEQILIGAWKHLISFDAKYITYILH